MNPLIIHMLAKERCRERQALAQAMSLVASAPHRRRADRSITAVFMALIGRWLILAGTRLQCRYEQPCACDAAAVPDQCR